MTFFVNLTDKVFTFRNEDGTDTIFRPSGRVARVNTKSLHTADFHGFRSQSMPKHSSVFVEDKFGNFDHLPSPSETVYIVTNFVLSLLPNRKDLMAAAIGPNDQPIKNTMGEIFAVTRINRN